MKYIIFGILIFIIVFSCELFPRVDVDSQHTINQSFNSIDYGPVVINRTIINRGESSLRLIEIEITIMTIEENYKTYDVIHSFNVGEQYSQIYIIDTGGKAYIDYIIHETIHVF